ncbi:50S ribosomal protein L25 [Agaricicola taiwanensis]|uniref:Large ribosomal subunit protein bL25 n=1 Tax=Agaricicola taiwanensis TaxID=591372 RepID=A0A8J2VNA7_9RHOB|nr:50S ribosomal protein L25/general stress protein Ctc [Agaricicola taiwanensis]GGE40100.1 50S ribosomal protein L25 [Agaricicola taiwanensis]
MSETKALKAEARDRSGKGAARALRREGKIPAVIYGDKKAPVGIALNQNDVSKLLFAGGFMTTIFDIDVGGKNEHVIPRDFQLDPVKDKLVHVDFLRVGKNSVISVEVPVHFINEEKSKGIKQGGVLNVVRHAVELYVPADKIPDFIEVDLAGTEIGDSIHISAIKLPADAKPVIQDRDFTVATIAPPTVPTVADEAADAAAKPEGEGEAEGE